MLYVGIFDNCPRFLQYILDLNRFPKVSPKLYGGSTFPIVESKLLGFTAKNCGVGKKSAYIVGKNTKFIDIAT